MTWLVFSYSLPSKAQSSPRVALWRRLRRLGAITLTGGIHVLPAREEDVEAFQWLAEEVQQAKGEAVVMRVEQFEGLTDADLIERFRRARAEDYAALEAQASALEERLRARLKPEERSRLRERLERLRRQHAEVARIDFFDAPEGSLVAAHLARIAQALAAGEASSTVRRSGRHSGLPRPALGHPATSARRSARLHLAHPAVHQPICCHPLREYA